MRECTKSWIVGLMMVALPSVAAAQSNSTDLADEDPIRVRAGANAGLALFVPGPSYGANFSGRGGVQINHWFGAYAEIGAGFGFGGGISAGQGGGGIDVSVVSYWRLSLMGEFDAGPFFVALGPGLFSGTYVGMSEGGDSSGNAYQQAWEVSGYYPTLMARVGLGFGHRQRFTIALEAMTVFGKMTSVGQSAGPGGVSQSVAIGNNAIGFAPALMLGWDMR